MHAAGLYTMRDLLLLKPNRYEDYRTPISSRDIQDGMRGTCTGVVEVAKQLYTKSRITIQQIIIRDQFGAILVQFFNQRFLLKTVRVGTVLSCSGDVKRFGTKIMFIPATYEVGKPAIHTGRLLPIYPELRGMSTRLIREKIAIVLETVHDIKEYLPDTILGKYALTPLHLAIRFLHSPQSSDEIARATRRLGFDELLKIQIATRMLRDHWNKNADKVPILFSSKHSKSVETFINSLPFSLTDDQSKAISDIKNDLTSGKRMNRFLQGDVGSGKTIVALVAAYFMHLSGQKTLYMAPTQILAEQQFGTFSRLLQPLGIRTALITGTHKLNSSLNAHIVIGTHALLTQIAGDTETGLVIIDEQHRFGVKQRALLSQKGHRPHLLTMTATPIPRTVALTLFGDLDMSVIQTMPKGRKEIKTIIVPDFKRENAYTWMNRQINEHSTQLFVVCPLIEGSSADTLQSVKSATEEYERLKAKVFPKQTVALLHGKMKSQEKSGVIARFASGKTSVLVTTSVVEVGIDIPNASIMCIEGAERFGLAQLHQLRGRVGRGDRQSYCLLFPTDSSIESDRLTYFARHTRGIELAEFDLKKRGPGSLYGFEQHGYLDVQFTNLSDMQMIEETQKAADYLLTNWKESDYPEFIHTAINFQKDLVAKD